MTDITNTTRISQVGAVFVPVADHTHCAFATEDIEADHATLRARSVDVAAEIAGTGNAGRGSSRSRQPMGIPCRRSSSSATPTGTAS